MPRKSGSRPSAGRKKRKTQSRKETSPAPRSRASSLSDFRSSGIPVYDFYTFLRERKRWVTTGFFFLTADDDFFNQKIRNYLIRFLRKREPNLKIVPMDDALPQSGGALIPIRYFVIRHARAVTDSDIRSALPSSDSKEWGTRWCILGWPSLEERIWTSIRRYSMIFHEPAIDPSRMSDWIQRVARVYGLKIDRNVANAVAIAVLYDPVPIIQAFENLALLQPSTPIRWADIEPYLPEHARHFAGTQIFHWLERKNYEQILQVISSLETHRPDLSALLRQGYELWRRWTLEEYAGTEPPDSVRRKWRMTLGNRSPGTIHLTPLQLKEWAQIASEIEQRHRTGDVPPEHLLAIAMFRWMRILA